MLQPNPHLFLHQIFMVILISIPIGYVTCPTVAQPYFEFKRNANVRIQLQQWLAYNKHKRKAKYICQTG